MTEEEIEKRLRVLIDEALLITDNEPLEKDLDDFLLPEVLDSVGMAALITLVEEEWSFEIEDEEIDADTLETMEGLAMFIRRKAGG
jgi:acyl carrier protein